MTWREVIYEVTRLPKHFWDLEAIITVDDDKGLYYEIEEIESRGVGAIDDWHYENRENKNFKYWDLKVWGEKTDNFGGRTWDEERDRRIDLILKD